jgi:hypothetical protein
MSNPAVITLSSVNLKNSINFRIEDNIGECIHIHYANFRFDMSINELLALEPILKSSISDILKKIDNFDINDFDIQFLASIANALSDLIILKKETIELKKLIVYNYKYGIPYHVKLNKSMMYRALNGDDKDYQKYKQENWFEEKNIERLYRIKEFITKEENMQPIVLFNNQNFIRDGQHRSAVYLKNNQKEINVIRLYFKNNKYNISNYPILNCFFCWNIDRLKKLYRKSKCMFYSIKSRMYYKLYVIMHTYKTPN